VIQSLGWVNERGQYRLFYFLMHATKDDLFKLETDSPKGLDSSNFKTASVAGYTKEKKKKTVGNRRKE
jgi:hypothetical protein